MSNPRRILFQNWHMNTPDLTFCFVRFFFFSLKEKQQLLLNMCGVGYKQPFVFYLFVVFLVTKLYCYHEIQLGLQKFILSAVYSNFAFVLVRYILSDIYLRS